MHVATAVYNYRFYFESFGVKHLEIPTRCSREEWAFKRSSHGKEHWYLSLKRIVIDFYFQLIYVFN